MAWMCLTLALLVKPQLVVVAPVLAMLHVQRLRIAPFAVSIEFAGSALCATVLVYTSTLPFTALRSPSDVFAFLVGRYLGGLHKAPNASEGAFNFYTIAGPFYTSDAGTFAGVEYRVWGVAIVTALIATIVLLFARWLHTGSADLARRRDDATLAASALCAFAVFSFATRMHERYLLPAIVFALPLGLDDLPAAAILAWLMSAFVLNCSFTIAGFYGGSHHPVTVLLAHACSLGNVVAFVLLADRFRRRFAPLSPG